MTQRIQTLDAEFTAALHDANLSLTGVAQAIHRNVPEVKQVALVKQDKENRVTFSVLFHDRERLSVTLIRMAPDEVLPEGEREVIRETDESLTLH